MNQLEAKRHIRELQAQGVSNTRICTALGLGENAFYKYLKHIEIEDAREAKRARREQEQTERDAWINAYRPPVTVTRRDKQRAKRVSDAMEGMRLLHTGMSVTDIAKHLGTSRTRLYIIWAELDPLLG